MLHPHLDFHVFVKFEMKWCISYKVCDAPASFHVAECVAKVFPGSERVPADDAHDGASR